MFLAETVCFSIGQNPLILLNALRHRVALSLLLKLRSVAFQPEVGLVVKNGKRLSDAEKLNVEQVGSTVFFSSDVLCIIVVDYGPEFKSFKDK